jgi:hypothetical protein
MTSEATQILQAAKRDRDLELTQARSTLASTQREVARWERTVEILQASVDDLQAALDLVSPPEPEDDEPEGVAPDA